MASLTLVSLLVCFVTAGTASGHVKWFCAYAIERQPDGLKSVVNWDFAELVTVAICALLFGTIIDETFVGRSLNRSFHRLRALLPFEGEVVIRVSCGFFLISLWAYGGIILTPELTTDAAVIPWFQLGLAACLLGRRSAIVTALGIVGLFGFGLAEYGIFHMADYPIFLGIAIYLCAVSLDRTVFGARPIDVLRWSTVVTLMWASVEKWAYPEWSYPLFATHHGLGFGISPPYYLRAAGVVEFSLAFALVGTPLVRRYAAILLAAIFTAAITSFGKIDAVGHAPIIGVLLAIVIDDYSHEIGRLRQIILVPTRYCGALAMIILLYYSAHAMIYGTSIL